MPRELNDNYYKIIVIGDDGHFYELNRAQWQVEGNRLDEAPDNTVADALANVTMLKEAGSYLAFLDPEIAAGAGMACTVVNLDAILREAKNRQMG